MTENVSRETAEKLDHLAEMVRKWTKKINLIAPGTVDNLFERHIADSLRLSSFTSPGQSWLDLGSGGGFPGLVLAIAHPEVSFTLIESDKRKCTFLRSVLRETETKATVIPERIEATKLGTFDVICARALAPLSDLLGFSEDRIAPHGKALFLKGKSWQTEVEQAEAFWKFQYNAHESQTDADGVILEISQVKRMDG